MSTLRETIRTTLHEGTTFNFGHGDIGLLPEAVINRLTTVLTDAVLSEAMFQALTNDCRCDYERVDEDRPTFQVRFTTPDCLVHGGRA